jgi:galactokinase
VDLLTGIVRKQQGCLGSRLAGIGWGGHLLCLVKAADAAAFVERVPAEYKKQVNISAQVFVNEPQDGAREVESPLTAKA